MRGARSCLFVGVCFLTGAACGPSAVPEPLRAPTTRVCRPIAELEAEGGFGKLAFAPDGRAVYATNRQLGQVEVLSAQDGARVASIPVGSEPAGFDFSPDGSRLYVANQRSADLSIVDLARGVETERILVPEEETQPGSSPLSGDRPYAIAVTVDGRRALVTTARPVPGELGGRVLELDLATQALVLRRDFVFEGRTSGRGVLWPTLDRQRIVVVEEGLSSTPLTAYDVAADRFTVGASLPNGYGGALGLDGTGSIGLLCDPSAGTLVDAKLERIGTVTADTAALHHTRCGGVAVHPNDKRAYRLVERTFTDGSGTASLEHAVKIVDLEQRREVGTLALPSWPARHLAMSPDGRRLAVGLEHGLALYDLERGETVCAVAPTRGPEVRPLAPMETIRWRPSAVHGAYRDYTTRALHAFGPRDLWAAVSNPAELLDTTHLLQWNGDRWTRVGRIDAASHAVAGDARGDAVWVVSDHGLVSRFRRTDAETFVPPPGLGDHYAAAETHRPTSEHLYGAWAPSGSELWVVGTGGTILRYDGRAWHKAVSGTTAPIFAVWGSPTGELWAVGGTSTTPLALYYDGTRWRRVRASAPGALRALYGADRRNVYAAGDGGTLLQWTGQAFRPLPRLTEAPLVALGGSGPRDVWAVGGARRGVPGEATVLHFDGLSWRATTAPWIERVEAVAAAPGALWLGGRAPCEGCAGAYLVATKDTEPPARPRSPGPR